MAGTESVGASFVTFPARAVMCHTLSTMLKVKVRWDGFLGSPGYSNFYFDTVDPNNFVTEVEAAEVAERVRVFFNAIKGRFPAAMTWSIQSDVDQVGETDGKIFGIESIPPIAPIAGAAVAAPHSGTSGVVITWLTQGVRNGRRVRGRTFLVPTSNSVYENNGTLNSTIQGEFAAAAGTLRAPVNGLQLTCWSRNTAPGVEDGESHLVTGSNVPDMAAILRSRRD
jgi:hypothetical protein